MNFLKLKQKSTKCIKKLEINETPPLISYTHNAYQSAIISSDAIAGKRVVEYGINDEMTLWKKIEWNGSLDIDNTIKVYSDMKHERGVTLQYRPLSEDDGVIVKVLAQRQMCAWEVLGIVLYDEEPDSEEKVNAPMLRYGFSSIAKIFVEINKKLINPLSTKVVMKYPFYIRLNRKRGKVTLQYSQGGRKWIDAYVDTLPGKCGITQVYVGVLTEIRNEYLNWLAQNYIQVSSGHLSLNEIYVDYYLGPTKNFQPFVTGHYLDFYDEMYDCEDFDKYKWFRIIAEKIQQGVYMVVDIDHYFIKETAYFNKLHRFHQVMIYGINMKKKTCYLMGYGEKNVIIHFEMSRSVLWKALSRERIKLICCRIDVNENTCKFDPVIIKKRLQDYLLKRRSDRDVTDIFPMMLSDNSGIDVYCSILENPNDLYVFCNNPRMSFFFYEHKRLMLQRFEYIKTKVCIDEGVLEEIQTCLEKNLNDSLIIKNLILMNAIAANRKQMMSKVRGYIEKIIENERRAYTLICDVLNELQ